MNNLSKLKFIKKPTFIIVLAAITFIGLSFGEKFQGEQAGLLNIGDKAPELSLSDPDGNERSLSSLKGKIVLIDFWASWCRPCRMENPNLVKTYGKYKDANFKNAEGFEIFSVSLDKSKASWVGAIDKDQLSWENHVSELKSWQSESATTYNINSIPATFLIDAEGTIIAKNLRGSSLDKALEKLTE